MKKKHVPPSIRETAFNCPHCGALTSQVWFKTFVQTIADSGIPFIPDASFVEKVHNHPDLQPEHKERWLQTINERIKGLVFLDEHESACYSRTEAVNLSISRCFNCKKLAVWIYDRLLFPPELHGEEPNIDIPDDILLDYEEARSILNLSHRGAAALLRLAIQKLCKYLGESGNNINDDIASLVRKGLSPIIQKSLDVVRVVGNEAVHPGIIDLRDDRDTASKLFRLVNLIAEQMISHPKHVNDMYEGLVPESKKKQIEKRDAKKP
ncbi:MAG: DUF4145 domain-containing protein [Syntrophales bacterium]|nr:DUF4145 domain-containing protein [Syntrophales bacterium]MDD5643419.1 DUF4145 domain-containing protein [Syntrophales bacterium]